MRVGSCKAVLLVGALLGLGCARTMAPLGPIADEAERARSESLQRSVEALAAPLTNLGRYRALEQRVAELGLEGRSRSEWIDWFSLQRNLLVEIPGSSGRVVYVVAHYDKIDATPLNTIGLLLNGALDPLFAPLTLSAGAVDNATGVAVALELAAQRATRESPYTFRFLFVGSEESGLRGSRAHVARLSRTEKDAIELAVVLDSVGLVATPNCVIDNVSDAGYAERARSVARELHLTLDSARLPSYASSDFEPFQYTSFGADFLRGVRFNLIGGLLPQRSWFTQRHSAPVLFFCGCELVDFGDYVASFLLLPFGNLHGPRDRADRVDARRLYEQFAIAGGLLSDLEARPADVPAPSAP